MASSNQTIFEVMEALNKRMAIFERDLHNTTTGSNSESIAADYTAFKSFTLELLRAFQLQLSALAHTVDQQEMRSRRKILLFHGIVENKDEVCTETITKVVSEQLNIPNFNIGCISRCQRMGRATQGNPRPVLVKFCELGVKDKVWFAKTNLKGTGTSISEFLTRPRHEAFMAARQRFGISACYTRNGYVFILSPDGERHRVTCLSELQKIAPEETIKPPVTKQTKKKTRKAAVAAPRKQ